MDPEGIVKGSNKKERTTSTTANTGSMELENSTASRTADGRPSCLNFKRQSASQITVLISTSKVNQNPISISIHYPVFLYVLLITHN